MNCSKSIPDMSHATGGSAFFAYQLPIHFFWFGRSTSPVVLRRPFLTSIKACVHNGQQCLKDPDKVVASGGSFNMMVAKSDWLWLYDYQLTDFVNFWQFWHLSRST